jgi:hypothetical protein
MSAWQTAGFYSAAFQTPKSEPLGRSLWRAYLLTRLAHREIRVHIDLHPQSPPASEAGEVAKADL